MSADAADAAIEALVRAHLEATGQPFEIIPCDPDLADTAAFCAAYGYSPDISANTIVVVGKSDPPVFAACVVLATCRLDVNGTVRRTFGVRKSSFASADDTMALTGMRIGGVTPFALPADVPVWVDAEVTRRERLVLGGGSRRTKVVCPPATLLALPGARVIEGLATPTAATDERTGP